MLHTVQKRAPWWPDYKMSLIQHGLLLLCTAKKKEEHYSMKRATESGEGIRVCTFPSESQANLEVDSKTERAKMEIVAKL